MFFFSRLKLRLKLVKIFLKKKNKKSKNMAGKMKNFKIFSEDEKNRLVELLHNKMCKELFLLHLCLKKNIKNFSFSGLVSSS